MNEEELQFEEYEYLVAVTVHKMYANPRSYAKSKGLEFDDLMQYGRYGLLDACRTWEQKQLGTFKNFAIRNIRWSIMKSVPREDATPHLYKYNGTTTRNPKDQRVNVLSMSYQPFGEEDDSTLYDVIANNEESIESQVLSELESNELFNILKPHEKEMVRMKMMNMNNAEIGKHYGISRQAINVKFKQMQGKINRHRGVTV
jgi:RNA polymerase sigma factor (sigma-70 family)